MSETATRPESAPNPSTRKIQIRWEDGRMRSSFANVCNAATTGEEINLFFGVNQTWKPGQTELTVELQDRIVLSPQTAKRLLQLLGQVIAGHEERFGPIEDARKRAGSADGSH